MKVYVVHANWHMDNQHEIKVFSTKEKACDFIREILVSHKFTDGVSPILRHNKELLSVDSVMDMIESKGFYINDWFGADHIHPFVIKLIEQDME